MSEKGYSELVEMLIIRGADLYASGDYMYSKTPLHLACLHGHTDCVRILVDRNADVAAVSGFLDKTPLHLACEAGHLLSASIIADTGTDLNVMGNRINGSTPLHLAVEHNHLDIARMLIQKGAKIEQWGRFTIVGPPLHYACQHGKIDAVRLMLELGAELDHRDFNAEIPLHIACKHSHFDIAILLLQLGSDHRLRGANGKCPMDYVNLPTIKEKLKIICDQMDAIREEKEYVAKEKRKQEEIQRRKEEKMRRDQEIAIEKERVYQKERRERFLQVLRAATESSGELSALQLVIEEFPEQNYNEIVMIVIPETDATAFLTACRSRFHDVMRQLLQWPGISVDHQDCYGNTALHYAAMNDDRELVEELLVVGVRTGLMNCEGRVAVNYAQSSYLQEIMRNPGLISSKVRYQNQVRLAMFNHASSVEHKTLTIAESAHDGLVQRVSPIKLQELQSPDSRKRALNVTAAKQLSTFSTVSTAPGGDLSRVAGSAQVVDKFGSLPESFGGSRADFFNLPVSKHNQQVGDSTALTLLPSLTPRGSSPETHAQTLTIDVFAMQRSYPPTSFDSTAEFCETKDFLWLLGRPYKKGKVQTGGEEGVEPHVDLEESVVDGGGGGETDKRYFLHLLARTMDELQRIFTSTDRHSHFNNLTAADERAGSGLNNAHSAKGDPTPFLPPISSGNNLINSTRATTYMTNYDKLPAIIHKGMTASHYSTDTHSVWSGIDENAAGNDLHQPSIDTANSSMMLYNRIAAANAVEVDFTHFYLPNNLTQSDFQRLIVFSQQCDVFMSHLFSLFEPEHYGWPDLSPQTGEAFTVYDKIALLLSGGTIDTQVQSLLYKLNTCCYSFNNDQYRQLHEYTEYVEQTKWTKRHKRRSDYTETHTKDYNIFRKDRVEQTDEEGKEGQEGGGLEEDMYVHQWELFTNPPRYLRVAVDVVFDLAQFVQSLSEKVYPLDAMRAHLWAQTGRQLIQTRLDKEEDPARRLSALQLWLSEAQLADYEVYFANEGFRILSDFLGLSEQDCMDYFPFLKIGDLRRLVKHSHALSEDSVRRYEKQARKRRG
eukprot:gene21270-27293_t